MYGKNQSSVGGDVQSDSVPGSSGGTDSGSVILARLDYIFTELRDLKADRAEVVSSVNACKNDIVTAISAIDERIKQCNDDNRQLKKANMKLQKELGEVKLQINELIQSTQYNSSVRINNVPYTEQENVYNIVQKIGLAIGFEVREERICSCYRQFFKKLTASYREETVCPSIILKFVNTKDKNEFLKSKKINRAKLTTELFSATSPGKPIFINENMSPYHYKLFRKVKELQKQIMIKYVWFQNGCIKVRVSDTSYVKSVKSENDLISLQLGLMGQKETAELGRESEYDEPDTDASGISTASTQSSKKRKLKNLKKNSDSSSILPFLRGRPQRPLSQGEKNKEEKK
uniref:FP protein C-terminal domain-containing protein n=1 Tax=Rhodnius prolixus TaxID=13249 RepID=T1HEE4_RHOPR